MPRLVFRFAGFAMSQARAFRHSASTSSAGYAVVHSASWSLVKFQVEGPVPIAENTSTGGVEACVGSALSLDVPDVPDDVLDGSGDPASGVPMTL